MRYGAFVVVFVLGARLVADEPRGKVGEKLARQGDEIVVCGQFFHTTTRVILWSDPGGYDAYRVEKRFAPLQLAEWRQNGGLDSPNRYSTRSGNLNALETERVRGGGWDLPLLQRTVDQFVLHYDVCGTSRRCFEVLHDLRGLSVHFMLDLDGTIYQTLDLKEKAWHATIANSRSIGIEIANMGAYPLNETATLSKWYRPGGDGKVVIIDPATGKTPAVADSAAVLIPSRAEPVVGRIQGQELRQYDLTQKQYDALARLAATLCTVFPKIKCDYPKDALGAVINHKLPDAELAAYQGILGHYHVQTNKVDPGPAFQWRHFIETTREIMAK
ncbi:MAG TPA: peptidoglycan recognition family protein [Isosphaeraceae bacterium]|nr:peptidoglycan recognition family protein [Isosphaeraceae bacterium]